MLCFHMRYEIPYCMFALQICLLVYTAVREGVKGREA